MHQREAGAADADSSKSDEIVYKIDVPANRYDLLCLEGLSRSLRVFLGMEPVKDFRVVEPASGARLQMHVEPATQLIRPHVVCAVLRGVTFTPESYNSFLDLQDHLHKVCRDTSFSSLFFILIFMLDFIFACRTFAASAVWLPSALTTCPRCDHRSRTRRWRRSRLNLCR
jgi:hypothetical protein